MKMTTDDLLCKAKTRARPLMATIEVDGIIKDEDGTCYYGRITKEANLLDVLDEGYFDVTFKGQKLTLQDKLLWQRRVLSGKLGKLPKGKTKKQRKLLEKLRQEGLIR